MDSYTIVGAGSIGGTLGAYMIRGGVNVLFVDINKDHVDAINRKGLTIRSYQETFTVPAKAVMPQDMPDQLNALVLAVKAHATRDALVSISAKLEPTGFIVSAQNGLNELMIGEVVGVERTIGCFVNFSADYLEPGLIHFGGPGAFYIGELNGEITDRLKQVRNDFSHWEGGKIRTTDNIWGFLWGKQGYGAMLYATALTNDSMADALDRNRNVVVALAREVLAVASAEGAQPLGFDGYEPEVLQHGTDAEINASIDGIVAVRKGDEKTHSGIWRDLAVRKRKTEVDAHFEPILSLSIRHGLKCPLLARMVEMIHEIEEGKRSFSQRNLDELNHLL
jgi:2-dehydropantoate 2-reductase